jgi:hypothetical protein
MMERALATHRTTLLTHGFTAHFDAMGVVHQAVEDAVGGGWVPRKRISTGFSINSLMAEIER